MEVHISHCCLAWSFSRIGAWSWPISREVVEDEEEQEEEEEEEEEDESAEREERSVEMAPDAV